MAMTGCRVTRGTVTVEIWSDVSCAAAAVGWLQPTAD